MGLIGKLLLLLPKWFIETIPAVHEEDPELSGLQNIIVRIAIWITIILVLLIALA